MTLPAGESVVVSCTLRAWPDEESERDNHVLACNVAKYLPIQQNSLTDLAINLS